MRSMAGGWRGRFEAACAMLLLVPAAGAAQGLAEYDYENLQFRGFGVEVGRIFPNRVKGATSLGARVDLGFLGPNVRIVPGFTYWSSDFKSGEVRELEEQLERLIRRETDPGLPPPSVDLGTVEWSDFVLSLEGHFMWSVPLGLLTYAGFGGSAHILNGEGEAIEGTFVEDLLDRLSPGLSAHAGVELPLDRFRLYGVARSEILEDLSYLELRVGGQLMIGTPRPGQTEDVRSIR